ncbi:hypothetical protein Tcan_01627, partial [Toxocara canis]
RIGFEAFVTFENNSTLLEVGYSKYRPSIRQPISISLFTGKSCMKIFVDDSFLPQQFIAQLTTSFHYSPLISIHWMPFSFPFSYQNIITKKIRTWQITRRGSKKFRSRSMPQLSHVIRDAVPKSTIPETSFRIWYEFRSGISLVFRRHYSFSS